MKHFRKVCSVLLVVAMVAVMLPTFISINSTVDAAEAGVVVNGDFSTYSSYTGSSGQTAWKADGWDVRDWGNTLGVSGQSGKGVQISKDGSHKDATQLTQVVPVNTNATYTFSFYAKAPKTDCDYVACFTYSLDLGTTSGNCAESVVSKAAINPGGTSWKQFTYTVTTGSNKYLKIRFIATGVGSGDSYLDTVALTAVNEGDTGTHAAPSLTRFATDLNRPASDSDNIIVQPGFESTTNAQWNTTNFLANGVSHVTNDAANAHTGSGYLKYYRGSVAPGTWSTFEITCPTAGEYVFSAWVRTPNLGTEGNKEGKASIGIIDRDTGKFLTYGTNDTYYGHFSTPEIQLRSTATDNDWHLRSVVFYVGAKNSNVKIGMYGLSSTMYVDDISVHLLSKGVTYSGNQKGTLSASTSVSNKFCESGDNLIPDCNLNGDDSKDFWSKASGWNLGMMEFVQDAQDSSHGTTLHYKGTNTGSKKLYYYIKWIYVEPNTSYTVSFDYRVAAAGNQLMFFDNNIETPKVFHTPTLGSASNSYKTYAFTFNTGNYKRIGIALKNHASAELYLDDFRFFKTSDGIATEPVEEVFPTLKHNKGEDNKVLNSRMEMNSSYENQQDGTVGLGFLFNLEATGITMNDQHVGNYDNAEIEAFEDGVKYKLIGAGAVMTNDATIGQNEKEFVRNNKGTVVNGKQTVIDVNAEKLFDVYHKEYYGIDTELFSYAIRIINIPMSHVGTTIYARPYYVFKYNGQEITVYGDIAYEAYEEIPDINDGWLEWD